MGALAALSDTTLLVGNRVSNRIEVLDLCTGTARWWWQLPSAPTGIALDPDARLLYVTLSGATRIAKIALDDAHVTLIELSAPAIGVAVGNDSIVFARLDDQAPFDAGVAIVDARRNKTLTTARGQFGELIAFHRPSNRLISGKENAGGLQAFQFDPATREFAPAESSAATGYNCSQLVVAPDDRRVFMACGSASGSAPAQSADFDPTDLTSPAGRYEPGLLSTSATFSAAGSQLFVGGSGVAQFDTATHTRVDTIAIPVPILISVAPSGRVLLGARPDVAPSTTWTLAWAVLAHPSDCR
jgi:DNA-binding beta-propeller fold protein YncE